MKTLRILAAAAMAVCLFETANAQVVLKARIGTPPPHRVVVVHRPPARRVVVVNHPYHRPYHRPYYAHRRTVVVRHPHRY